MRVLGLSKAVTYPLCAIFRHACVALKVTEKLLAECEQRHLQLIADSYLDMLHVMLESPQSTMRIMATKSVSSTLADCLYSYHFTLCSS